MPPPRQERERRENARERDRERQRRRCRCCRESEQKLERKNGRERERCCCREIDTSWRESVRALSHDRVSTIKERVNIIVRAARRERERASSCSIKIIVVASKYIII